MPLRHTELEEGEHLIDILNSDPKGNGIKADAKDRIEKDGKIVLSVLNRQGTALISQIGNLFITNKRIIFEDATGEMCYFFLHEDIKNTEGRNGTWLNTGHLSFNLFGWEDRDIDWNNLFADANDVAENAIESDAALMYDTVSYGKDLSEKLNSEFYSNPEERVKFYEQKVKLYEQNKEETRIQNEIVKAKRHEKLLDFDKAAKIYKELEMDDELIRIRKLKSEQGAVKVSQKVVHGDEITKTEIKDSVVSKSNIGSSGDDKIAKLEKIAEMKDKGIIDDDEFQNLL